jgi:hypothetical protein
MSETGVDASFLRKECVWLVILCNVGNFFGNSYSCALLTIDESEFFLNDLDFIIYPILSCSIFFILEFFKTYYLLFLCNCYCLVFGISML